MPGELIADMCSGLALATNFANGISDWQATSTTESANFAANFILEVEAWLLKEEVEGRRPSGCRFGFACKVAKSKEVAAHVSDVKAEKMSLSGAANIEWNSMGLQASSSSASSATVAITATARCCQAAASAATNTTVANGRVSKRDDTNSSVRRSHLSDCTVAPGSSPSCSKAGALDCGFCMHGMKCNFRQQNPHEQACNTSLCRTSCIYASVTATAIAAATDQKSSADANAIQLLKAASNNWDDRVCLEASCTRQARWIWQFPAPRLWVQIFLHKLHPEFDVVKMLVGHEVCNIEYVIQNPLTHLRLCGPRNGRICIKLQTGMEVPHLMICM